MGALHVSNRTWKGLCLLDRILRKQGRQERVGEAKEDSILEPDSSLGWWTGSPGFPGSVDWADLSPHGKMAPSDQWIGPSSAAQRGVSVRMQQDQTWA